MTQTFEQTLDEFFEVMQLMRDHRFSPPIPSEVTGAESRAIVAINELAGEGEGVRPGQVAGFAHTTPSALSQTFKALEEKGYIVRTRSSDDCRAVAVSLTPQGREIAEKGRQLCEQHMRATMEYLGQDDVQQLTRIVKKIYEFHAGQEAKGGRACE